MTSDWFHYSPPVEGRAPKAFGKPRSIQVLVAGEWYDIPFPTWNVGSQYRYRTSGLSVPSTPYSESLTTNSLPEDDALRGAFPMADGLIDYFPNALAEVSKVSKHGNEKHNPGQPMHWARGKSTDHRNKITRHLIDAGGKDKDGIRHSAYLAWRALALLQEELERDEGYPVSRGSRPA
jgi:hypothetical protein